MLKLALLFLASGFVAAYSNYPGLAAGAVSTAKVLFCLFLVLYILSTVAERLQASKSPD